MILMWSLHSSLHWVTFFLSTDIFSLRISCLLLIPDSEQILLFILLLLSMNLLIFEEIIVTNIFTFTNLAIWLSNVLLIIRLNLSCLWKSELFFLRRTKLLFFDWFFSIGNYVYLILMRSRLKLSMNLVFGLTFLHFILLIYFDVSLFPGFNFPDPRILLFILILSDCCFNWFHLLK